MDNEEVLVAEVKYRRVLQINDGNTLIGWSTQMDDGEGCGVFDTKRLERSGFLTDECDCQLILRKKNKELSGDSPLK